MFNPDIYRAYDIRGIVPDDFDAEEGYHLGRAYAKFTGVKNVVVARDMRLSGDAIEPEVIRGLTEGGVNVISIGQATSPMFYFAVHHLKAEGGVMVTASHNPGKYNGAKLTLAEAVPISGDNGIYEIRDLVKARSWEEAADTGEVTKASVKDAYLEMVTNNVDASGLKIVVDAGNGMTGILLKDYFDQVGGEVTSLYWEPDGSFPNHEADPLKEENMADLKQAVKEHEADLGVAFDGDGDRVFFCTEAGVTVPGDLTTALIAGELLQEQPGSKILYDLRASRTTREFIEESGGQPIMYRVGHSFIKAKMRQEKAIFAGEVSGHFFFTPFYAESGFLAMGYIIRLLQEKKEPFSKILAPLQRYPKTPELNFEVADKQAAMDRIKSKYSDADISEIDGVRIEYPKWWASIRPSNTEPLLRLNMEADTQALLDEKKQEIEEILQQG